MHGAVRCSGVRNRGISEANPASHYRESTGVMTSGKEPVPEAIGPAHRCRPEQLNSLHNFSGPGLNEKCAFTVMDRSTRGSFHDFARVRNERERRQIVERPSRLLPREETRLRDSLSETRTKVMYARRRIEKFRAYAHGETIPLPLVAFERI